MPFVDVGGESPSSIRIHHQDVGSDQPCVPLTWRTELGARPPEINVPTPVVRGEKGRILPIAACGAKTHAGMVGSRHAVIEGAPHGSLWTCAEEVNRMLAEPPVQTESSIRQPALSNA